MTQEGLMSEKDFSYHLSTFMEYMRRMENGMSDQWDRFEKFQIEVKSRTENILEELSKNERLADIGALVEGLRTQFHHEVIGIRHHIGELKEGREDLNKIRESIEYTHRDFLNELKELVNAFKTYSPEELVKRGALQALEMVREFKEAYEYIKKVKSTLKSGDLPCFEVIPLGVKRDVWCENINPNQCSQRFMTVMDRLEVKTLGDLASMSSSGLFRTHGCGRHTVREIETLLEHHGLKLGMTKK